MARNYCLPPEATSIRPSAIILESTSREAANAIICIEMMSGAQIRQYQPYNCGHNTSGTDAAHTQDPSTMHIRTRADNITIVLQSASGCLSAPVRWTKADGY